MPMHIKADANRCELQWQERKKATWRMYRGRGLINVLKTIENPADVSETEFTLRKPLLVCADLVEHLLRKLFPLLFF